MSRMLALSDTVAFVDAARFRDVMRSLAASVTARLEPLRDLGRVGPGEPEYCPS
jgi:hypothetical protein